MKLMIDSLDGNGVVDYTAWLDPASPLAIKRTLNEPSTFQVKLAAGAPVPARRGRVMVTNDAGTTLFTGYIAVEPMQEFAGMGLAGATYRASVAAVSDEWLLDRQIVTVGSTDAARSYRSYRVLDGAPSVTPIGATTHSFSDADGTLNVAALKTAQVKELANDVTVTGAIEPATFATEIFTGDGTTNVFSLSEEPFGVSTRLIDEQFNHGVINPQVWTLHDAGGHLGQSGGGLAMNGGNGFDGQTVLSAITPVEMGGTLLIEAGRVLVNGASDGVLCGLYRGDVNRPDCFAGFNVRQYNGTTLLTPYLNGAEVGTSLTVLAGHSYRLRLRLHCAEVQRVMQTYYAMVDGAVQAFGGGEVAAPMQVVFEVVDLGLSSNTPAMVLYDSASAGPVLNTPAMCTFAIANCVQMFGTVGYCRVTRTKTTWVTGTQLNGAVATKLMGAAGEGADCSVTSTGTVTFFPGRVPAPGETVSVAYRTKQRSVARLQDAASIAVEAQGGAPGTMAWLGKVLRPAARSSADCEQAAVAVLAMATSQSAALAGSYAVANPQMDIWPGDVLALTMRGVTTNVVVRRVTVNDDHVVPEMLLYKLDFANDWAEELGVSLSEEIAEDAIRPAVAANAPAQVLANLSGLSVVHVSETEVLLDTGIVPPDGGGFEVRRRDEDFNEGADADLVLRVLVRTISIPREGMLERYYVRMFDGSNPPVYSRVSAAVWTHVPVG